MCAYFHGVNLGPFYRVNLSSGDAFKDRPRTVVKEEHWYKRLSEEMKAGGYSAKLEESKKIAKEIPKLEEVYRKAEADCREAEGLMDTFNTTFGRDTNKYNSQVKGLFDKATKKRKEVQGERTKAAYELGQAKATKEYLVRNQVIPAIKDFQRRNNLHPEKMEEIVSHKEGLLGLKGSLAKTIKDLGYEFNPVQEGENLTVTEEPKVYVKGGNSNYVPDFYKAFKKKNGYKILENLEKNHGNDRFASSEWTKEAQKLYGIFTDFQRKNEGDFGPNGTLGPAGIVEIMRNGEYAKTTSRFASRFGKKKTLAERLEAIDLPLLTESSPFEDNPELVAVTGPYRRDQFSSLYYRRELASSEEGKAIKAALEALKKRAANDTIDAAVNTINDKLRAYQKRMEVGVNDKPTGFGAGSASQVFEDVFGKITNTYGIGLEKDPTDGEYVAWTGSTRDPRSRLEKVVEKAYVKAVGPEVKPTSVYTEIGRDIADGAKAKIDGPASAVAGVDGSVKEGAVDAASYVGGKASGAAGIVEPLPGGPDTALNRGLVKDTTSAEIRKDSREDETNEPGRLRFAAQVAGNLAADAGYGALNWTTRGRLRNAVEKARGDKTPSQGQNRAYSSPAPDPTRITASQPQARPAQKVEPDPLKELENLSCTTGGRLGEEIEAYLRLRRGSASGSSS